MSGSTNRPSMLAWPAEDLGAPELSLAHPTFACSAAWNAKYRVSQGVAASFASFICLLQGGTNCQCQTLKSSPSVLAQAALGARGLGPLSDGAVRRLSPHPAPMDREYLMRQPRMRAAPSLACVDRALIFSSTLITGLFRAA